MQQKQSSLDIKVQVDASNSKIVNIHINGDLSFATVPLAYEQTKSYFDERKSIQVDLNNVYKADSAAMALVLEWHRLAKKNDAEIILLNVPLILKNIASVTDLNILLS